MQYEVTFIREVVNAYGKRREMPLKTIFVRAARSRERAVSAAVKRFEREHCLARWDLLAQQYRLRTIKAGASSVERCPRGPIDQHSPNPGVESPRSFM